MINNKPKCLKCHRRSVVVHPYLDGKWLCSEHFYKLTSKGFMEPPMSSISSFYEKSIKATSLDRLIWSINQNEASFTERLNLAIDKLHETHGIDIETFFNIEWKTD